MKKRCPYNDSQGKPLYEGDLVKIGQLKGFYVVEWDAQYEIWRLKMQDCDSGIAFRFVKYKIKKLQ